MSVTVTLLEITPEIWQEEWFQQWIAEGVETGEIPVQVSDFREPKLSDIEAILEEFTDINVEQTRNENQLHIVFSKLSIFSMGIRYYVYHEDIYVTSLSDGLQHDSLVTIDINTGSSERMDKFLQLLANQCGVFLVLHNGEPFRFFIPNSNE